MPDEFNALKRIRKMRGLSQAKAASKTGMSRSLWSALELKQRPMSVAILNKIQVALELSDNETKYIRTWWGDAHCSVGGE
jgi:transcriptional regulator with XRE-family HTH domain